MAVVGPFSVTPQWKLCLGAPPLMSPHSRYSSYVHSILPGFSRMDSPSPKHGRCCLSGAVHVPALVSGRWRDAQRAGAQRPPTAAVPPGVSPPPPRPIRHCVSAACGGVTSKKTPPPPCLRGCGLVWFGVGLGDVQDTRAAPAPADQRPGNREPSPDLGAAVTWLHVQPCGHHIHPLANTVSVDTEP